MKFEEILDEYNVPYSPPGSKYSREGWVNFFCPYCKSASDPDKTYMGYNVSGNYINCWRCGRHQIAQVLADLIGIDFSKARQLALQIDTQYKYITRPVPRGKLILPKGLGPLLTPHRKYLTGRHFLCNQLMKFWGIQGIGIAARLSWRIFIPIHYDGQIVSWTTRSISKTTDMRYISASTSEEYLPHKEMLYGEDYARNAIIVVEGPTDVWRIGVGAVCTMGTTVSRAQIAKMSKYPVRAICFDNEPEAQHRAKKLCSLLEPFPGETYNVCLDAKDPGSAQKKEIDLLRKSFLE